MTETSGAKPVSQAKTNLTTVDSLLQELSDSGLSKFLRDKATADRIARYVAKETGYKLVYIRLAMRLITPLVVNLAEAGGRWIGGIALMRLKSILEHSDWCRNCLNYLKTLAEKTAGQANAEKALKDYLKNLDADQRVEGAEDLSLELRTALGTHELLAEMANDLKQDVADLREFLTPFLNPQPVFKKLLDSDKEARFIYRSRLIPFVGRDEEMERLRRFLFSADSCKHNFCWQAITGPGGTGKSRLALELCEANGGAIRAGIMLDGEHNFHTWQPDMPALLVVDYASTDRECLKAMLRTLAHRAESFEYPIRVLLLDRDTAAQFLDELSDDHDIRQHRYDTPWALPEMRDDDLWDIMQYFFTTTKAIPPGTRADHLAHLREIDNNARPLFAAYYADAVAQGRCGTQCDRMSLLRDVIKHEEYKYWQPAGVTEADKALLALATITRGITSLHTNLPEGVTTMQDLIQDTKRFLALGGIKEPHPQGEPQWLQRIPQWEPDLVGELFVLQFLSPDMTTGENKWIGPLLRAAWKLQPLFTAMFIQRVMQDYPDDLLLKKLVKRPEYDLGAYIWAMWADNLINAYGTAGKLPEAQALYDDLAALAQANKGIDVIALQQARGAVNLITAYGKAGKLLEAQVLYDDLAALAQALYDDLAALAQANKIVEPRLGMRWYDDIDALTQAQKIIGPQLEMRWLDDFSALALANKYIAEIYLQQARGAFNLITAYGKAGKLPEAQALYDDLAALAQANKIVRPQLGMRWYDDLAAHAQANKIVRPQLGIRWYDDLAALAQANKCIAEIYLQQALGAFNLITAYGKAGKLPEAQALYNELAALAQANKSNAEIALEQAWGAFKLLLTAPQPGSCPRPRPWTTYLPPWPG